MPHIYFDHAATTRVLPEVLEAMLPYYTDYYANPSSIHQPGQEAHLGLNLARKQMATFLGCTPEEIYFTSGATESTNTALRGIVKSMQSRGKHIITSQFEHAATLETCKSLEAEGYEVTYLSPNTEGFLTLAQIQEALRPDTICVSLLYVQNELGSIQPIPEIGAFLQEKGIFFHTDAVQAFQYLPCQVDSLHVDSLSLSAHKFHGPKGVGLLYLRKGWDIAPLLTGGNQEFGLRSGTQNVPGIVGMGKAAELALEYQASHKAHVEDVREYLREQLKRKFPMARITTPLTNASPHILNLSIDGADGEALLIRLDLEGIALSTGSACSSEKKDPSHSLLAIGCTPDEAQGSIRVSLGFENTKKEVDIFVEKLLYHGGRMLV